MLRSAFSFFFCLFSLARKHEKLVRRLWFGRTIKRGSMTFFFFFVGKKKKTRFPQPRMCIFLFLVLFFLLLLLLLFCFLFPRLHVIHVILWSLFFGFCFCFLFVCVCMRLLKKKKTVHQLLNWAVSSTYIHTYIYIYIIVGPLVISHKTIVVFYFFVNRVL